jgi:CRISPR-associated protein (TIGR02584 family)
LPQRITVITTRAGQETVQRLLPDQLAELAQVLGAPLPTPDVYLLRRPDGQPLEDIVTEEDNRAAADGILAAVAEATLDPAWNVHLSIAGGRKTMGCLATIALSLCGREGDELSHVLVHPALQGREDFFFPPAPPREILLPGGGSISTEAHGLTLASIPFVRLRAHWRPERDGGGFASAVAAIQEGLLPARMRIDLAARRVHAGPAQLRLPPVLLATLLLFAERAIARAPALTWRTEAEAKALAGSLLAAIERIVPQRDLSAMRKALTYGIERAYLAEKVSRLNRAFREALGPAAEPFLIRSEGRRPRIGYRLPLPPEAITIIGKTARAN